MSSFLLFLVLLRARRPWRGRLLLILPLDRMTALMVGAARTTEEKIHVHGLHNVSPANLQLAGEIRPELIVILSDINMPGMDGLTLLDEVKRRHPICRS